MRARWPWLAAAFALLVPTVWIIHEVGLNHDVAWFLQLAQQVREGAMLYGTGLRDPKELNPPLAIWLLVAALKAVALMRWPASAAPTVLVALEASAAIALTWRLLRPLSQASRAACVLATALATITFVGYDLAQREHQLVLLLTPALWSLALCAADAPRSRGDRIVAGALAGIGIAFKPHFVVAWGVVEMATALIVRRPRLVWRAETITAGVVVTAYALSVIVWAPGYFPMIREAAPLYLGSLNRPWLELFRQPEAVLAGAVLAIAAVRSERRDPLGRASIVFALSAATFALVAVGQRKGFSYHWYPAYAWALLAASIQLMADAPVRALQLAPQGAVAGVLLAMGLVRVQAGVVRGRAHRETVRQLRRAAGGSVHGNHDLFILSVPVEGPQPAASYLGLWHTAPALFAITMRSPDDIFGGASGRTLDAQRDQMLRDLVWEEISEAMPRTIAAGPMYSRGEDPTPSATRTVADFFTVDPRFAQLFTHYQPVGRVDRLGQPYYVILRRMPDLAGAAR